MTEDIAHPATYGRDVPHATFAALSRCSPGTAATGP